MKTDYKKLKKEGITKEILEAVDLDIAYSPVLKEDSQFPTDVNYKTKGGNYYLEGANKPVTAEELKIMRARYLINRKQPEFVKDFFGGEAVKTIKYNDKKGMKELKNFTNGIKNFDFGKWEVEQFFEKL